MEALAECYRNANNWQTRRQILSIMADKVSFKTLKVTRPSFFGGYHPTLTLSGIPTFTFIASLTHRMDNI